MLTPMARLIAAGIATATLSACGGPPPAGTVTSVAAGGQVASLTTGTTNLTATSATDPTKSDAITLTVNPADAPRWTRQFGASSSDIARGIATDAAGNVDAAGDTLGALEGPTVGGNDAFVRSYAP